MTHTQQSLSSSAPSGWRRFFPALVFFGVCYLALVGLSAVVFYAPWSVLSKFSDPKRNLLISMGVFSPRTHPQYREWLRNFVRIPNTPNVQNYFMDTYVAYGSMVEGSIDEEDNDFLGFPNAVSPRDAQLLFVGDSFCVGASVGSRRAPAALVGKLTDKKVYNGSTGGYGIAQYLGIIKMLTQGLPAEQRYTGKDVVVMFYVGNDFNVDIIHDQRRRSYTRGAFFWLLELGPLRAWMEYISDSLAHAALPVQIPTGLYAPIPMKCRTAGGLPFAWHPGFSTFLKPKNIAEPRAEAWELIGELGALQSAGLNIKVVVVPANIQVIFDDIDWQAIPPASPIAVNSPKIYSILNDVKADALSMFKSYGFDTLDMTPIFRAAPDRCLYYQPADTHCTSLGYETIAKAIVAKWPDLAGTGPQ